MKISKLLKKLNKYRDVFLFLGFVLVFLFGEGYFQKGKDDLKWEAEMELKADQASMSKYELRYEKHNESRQLLPVYQELRAKEESNDLESDKRLEYTLLQESLFRSIAAYNRIEANIAVEERRSPDFFEIPLPPPSPKNLTMEDNGDGTMTIKWEAGFDPLREKVNEHLRLIYTQYNQPIPRRLEARKVKEQPEEESEQNKEVDTTATNAAVVWS